MLCNLIAILLHRHYIFVITPLQSYKFFLTYQNISQNRLALHRTTTSLYKAGVAVPKGCLTKFVGLEGGGVVVEDAEAEDIVVVGLEIGGLGLEVGGFCFAVFVSRGAAGVVLLLGVAEGLAGR